MTRARDTSEFIAVLGNGLCYSVLGPNHKTGGGEGLLKQKFFREIRGLVSTQLGMFKGIYRGASRDRYAITEFV